MIAHPDSLTATLDAVNEAYFYGRPPSRSEREKVAKWISGRQGLPGSYADMFAPTKSDYAEGVRLFTGEKVKTMVGMAHILGEEACRALIVLDVALTSVKNALVRASKEMAKRLRQTDYPSYRPGMYCCGRCSASLWRHLAAGGLEHGERYLAAGIKTLRSYRDGKGRWKVFPYYYTLLALSELDLPSAVREMKYAAPGCERLLKRSAKDDVFERRRRDLARKILERR